MVDLTAAGLKRQLEEWTNTRGDLADSRVAVDLLHSYATLRLAEAVESLFTTPPGSPEESDPGIPTWARDSPAIADHVNAIAYLLADYKRESQGNTRTPGSAASVLARIQAVTDQLKTRGVFVDLSGVLPVGVDDRQTLPWMLDLAVLFADWISEEDEGRMKDLRELIEAEGCAIETTLALAGDDDELVAQHRLLLRSTE